MRNGLTTTMNNNNNNNNNRWNVYTRNPKWCECTIVIIMVIIDSWETVKHFVVQSIRGEDNILYAHGNTCEVDTQTVNFGLFKLALV